MKPTLSIREKESPTTVIKCLVVRRRRELLALLKDHGLPLNVRELAIQLAAREKEKSKDDVTQEEMQTVHAELHHVHLPLLDDAALVDWDRSEEAVTTTEHPALHDPQFQRIIETDTTEWDAVIANLTNTRRRIIFSVLADEDGPLSRDELAQEVAARDPNSDTQSDEEKLLLLLHHIHLPKLADAGLVEYDADAGTVTYEGHPELEAEWLEFAPDETHRTVLTAAQHSPDT